jgi:hypothetical protein
LPISPTRVNEVRHLSMILIQLRLRIFGISRLIQTSPVSNFMYES